MKVLILLASGFELVEATIPYDVLKRAGMEVSFVSIEGDVSVESASENRIEADQLFEHADFNNADLIITPGGMPGSERLRDHDGVIEVLRKRAEEKKWIASICASPIALDKAGVLENRRFTCYPGFEERIHNGAHQTDRVIKDDFLITAKGPGVAFEFAFAIVEEFLGEEKVNDLKEEMLYVGP